MAIVSKATGFADTFFRCQGVTKITLRQDGLSCCHASRCGIMNEAATGDVTEAGMAAKRQRPVILNWVHPQRVSTCAPSIAGRKNGKARDFAIVLTLTAVIGAACQVVETAIDFGRSAGWWT